ncbi:MAG: arylsulfatase [Bacteroidales bacterium]
MNTKSFPEFIFSSGGWNIKLLAITCVTGSLFSCSPEKKKDAPNIIFIVADDLGYGDLSCYGQKRFQTPNIDRLAKEGMLFTRFYAGSTVSAPSRSCLMTGMHTGHTYIRGNKELQPEGQWPLPDSAVTLPEVLKQQGYITGAFGKWGLGFIDTEGDPNRQGFDEFFGYNCQRLAHNYYPEYLWKNHEKILLPENDSGKTGLHSAVLIQKEALQFIEKNKDKPFFLFFPVTIPHAELSAPEEYMEKHRGKYEPEKSFQGIDSGPDFRKGGYASQPNGHAAFAAMINMLDDYVDEIMTKLEELGIAENTIIIFNSDNGPHLEGGADPDYFDSNGPLRGYKRDLYEGGIRVPMLVRWPGKIKPGSVTEHIAAFWDIMPTLAEIAGTKTPEGIDGISFVPTLLGKGKQKQHDYLYWEFHEQGGKQAVLMGDWKGVRLEANKNPEGKIELYNLREDTAESREISAKHPDVVRKMEQIMKIAHSPSKEFPFEYEQ